MMISSVTVRFAAFVSLAMMTGFAIAEAPLADATVDGLQLVKDTNLSLVYAQPDADLSTYNRIYLTDPYIAFKKNWERSQNRDSANRVTADDMTRIKAQLAMLFSDVFIKTLEEGGYELVTERAEDVLLVKPAIINLDIVAPTTSAPGISYTFSESAGEMTLYLELYDSVSDDLIAKALDRKIDRHTGYFRWHNRVSNRAAARRILQEWARVLKEGLDEARGVRADIESNAKAGIKNP